MVFIATNNKNLHVFLIRFLLINYFTKVFFTSCTFIFTIVHTVSSECIELVNFPWVLVYYFFTRVTLMADTTTYVSMSFVKVILNWRPDIYVKLNSNFTVNLATLIVGICIGIDSLIRIDLHIYNNCVDLSLLKLFQYDLHREFCFPQGLNHSTNASFCERFDQTDVMYPIGCDLCPPNPTLRVLLGFLILLEGTKFMFGFKRIVKKYLKKNTTKKIKLNSLNGSTGRSQAEKLNKVEPVTYSTSRVKSDATYNIPVTDGNVYMGPLYDDHFELTDELRFADHSEIGEGLEFADKLEEQNNCEHIDNKEGSSDVDLEIEDFFENSVNKLPTQLDLSSDKLETSLTFDCVSKNYPTNFTVKVIVTAEPETDSLHSLSDLNFNADKSLYNINTISNIIDSRTEENLNSCDTIRNVSKEKQPHNILLKPKHEINEEPMTEDVAEGYQISENHERATNTDYDNNETVKSEDITIEPDDNNR